MEVTLFMEILYFGRPCLSDHPRFRIGRPRPGDLLPVSTELSPGYIVGHQVPCPGGGVRIDDGTCKRGRVVVPLRLRKSG